MCNKLVIYVIDIMSSEEIICPQIMVFIRMLYSLVDVDYFFDYDDDKGLESKAITHALSGFFGTKTCPLIPITNSDSTQGFIFTFIYTSFHDEKFPKFPQVCPKCCRNPCKP